MERLLLVHITLLLRAAVAWSVPTARTVYGAVGRPVTLICGSSGEYHQGEDIAWQWNGDVWKLGDGVKAEGVHLSVRKASPADAGTYSCRSRASGNEVDRILLKIGYPPEKPNITCRSYNYPESFQCTWEPGRDTLLATNISADYRNPMSQTFLPCELMGDHSCIGNDLVMYSSMAHLVTVRVTNPLGSAEGRAHFVLEDIIQPNPPVNVSARVTASEAVTVMWTLPASWLDPFLFPLQHRLRFRLAGSGDAWRTNVLILHNFSTPVCQRANPQHLQRKLDAPLIIASSFFRQTTFPGESVEEQELRGLRPRTRYEVQVSIKDLLDLGYWSEWSESAFVRMAASRRPGYGCLRELRAAVGDKVRIPCKGTPAFEPRWTFNGAPLAEDPSAWRQSKRSGHITLLNVTLGSSGFYSCKGNNYVGRPHKRCTHLLVGYPPAEPTIACRSFDYPESFQCEWTAADGGISSRNTTYSASYRTPLDERPLPCEPVPPNACQGREVTLFSEQPHELTVTATNSFGSVKVHHTFLLEDIIQPDPPVKVCATWIGVGRVLVSWEQPATWNIHPAFPLTYRLHYRIPGERRWSKVRVPGESSTTFVLALPARVGAPRPLEVCVSAREALGSGMWSVCSPPAQVMPDAPRV